MNKEVDQTELNQLLSYGAKQLFEEEDDEDEYEMKDTLIEVNKDGVVSYIHKPKTEAKEEKKNENFTQRQIKISSKKEKPLKYDDAAIEKLLDRDQKSTVEDSNAQLNEYLGSFTVASVWNNGETQEVTEDGAEVKQEEENIDQFWDKLLQDKYEQYLAEKNDSYGRGKRLKKQVSYTADMFEDAGEEKKQQKGKKRKLEESDSDVEFEKKEESVDDSSSSASDMNAEAATEFVNGEEKEKKPPKKKVKVHDRAYEEVIKQHQRNLLKLAEQMREYEDNGGWSDSSDENSPEEPAINMTSYESVLKVHKNISGSGQVSLGTHANNVNMNNTASYNGSEHTPTTTTTTPTLVTAQQDRREIERL
jgi:hypothetical protein